MAVDKKSQHVGNHGGRYTDIDGNTKQFTYIDHDRHTSRLKSWNYTRKQSKKTKTEELITQIFQEGINELDDFIKVFDTKLAKKYGFERFRKGSPISGPQLEDISYKDLKQLYDRFTVQAVSNIENSGAASIDMS